MADLEQTLRASVYHQLAIRLVKALVRYGAHAEDCGQPCNCGWDDEVNSLLNEARRQSLGVVPGGNRG